MKKSSKVFQAFLLISFLFYSCEGVKLKKYTPKEFLNHNVTKKEDYAKDSSEVVRHLKDLLLKREDFFNNKAYFDSTQLIIDSIIYSPDFNKLAVFAITKNPVKKQLAPDDNYEWYYDATCYLGVRQNDMISLSWLGPSFTNSYDKSELSGIIRDFYFTNFASENRVELYAYEYNLNDIRFWNCSIWKEIENKKIRKKKFEEEKINHPENVYQPKNK